MSGGKKREEKKKNKRKSFFFLEAFLSMCTIHNPNPLTFCNDYTVVKNVTMRDPDGISCTKDRASC